MGKRHCRVQIYLTSEEYDTFKKVCRERLWTDEESACGRLLFAAAISTLTTSPEFRSQEAIVSLIFQKLKEMNERLDGLENLVRSDIELGKNVKEMIARITEYIENLGKGKARKAVGVQGAKQHEIEDSKLKQYEQCLNNVYNLMKAALVLAIMGDIEGLDRVNELARKRLGRYLIPNMLIDYAKNRNITALLALFDKDPEIRSLLEERLQRLEHVELHKQT